MAGYPVLFQSAGYPVSGYPAKSLSGTSLIACMVSRDVPIPKFEPIPVPIPILNFNAKPIPILNRYRYLDFSVLKFIYTPFYSKGDTSRTGHS